MRPLRISTTGTLTAIRPGLFPAAPTEVRARLSKNTGVPEGYRDVLGLAVRVPRETGPWDLVLSTVGPFGRVVPFPSVGWCDRPFSTLVPCRIGGRPRWFLAQAAAGQPDVDASLRAARRLVRGGPFELIVAEAGVTGVPRPIAWLTLHTLGPDDEQLDFEPMLNHPPGAMPYPDWLAKAWKRSVR